MKAGDLWHARRWLEDAAQGRDAAGDVAQRGDARAYATLSKGLAALEHLREVQGELAGLAFTRDARSARRAVAALNKRIAGFLQD